MHVRDMIVRALRLPCITAIRGATTVAADDGAAIEAAVSELLMELCRRNALRHDELISAFFTVTPDLIGRFPAEVARRSGWADVPMLCATEIAVPGALPRCVRIMLHVSRPRHVAARHVYLRDAARLRPDLIGVAERTALE